MCLLRSDEVTKLQSGLRRFVLQIQADPSGLRITVLRLDGTQKVRGKRGWRHVSVIIVLYVPSRPI